MWRNYLKVGFRALAKNKTYAFINIFGLSVGLAACLILLIYVRYESGYDEWIPEAERIYQVQTISADPEDSEEPVSQFSHGIIVETWRRDFPQIEEIVRLDSAEPVFLKNGEPSAAPMYLTEENFFRVVPLPFLRGDPATALRGMDSLVVSRTEAMKRFGTLDAVGQMVTAIRRGEQSVLRVTGVFEDIPRHSHMDFGLIGRISERDKEECGWGCINGFVYAKLRPGADPQEIERQLPAWERRSIPPVDVGAGEVSEGDLYDWRLVNVRNVHLSGARGPLERPGNDRSTLVTFAVVALLILAMAAVNFINLATARASQRAREVALRKVLGATRKQLIAQFLTESLVVTGIAVLLSLLIVELALPHVAAFLDSTFEVSWFGIDGVLLPVLLLWLMVGLAGGLYPAFYLSRYRPAEVLKANQSTAEPLGTGWVRMGLVVAQFAVSIGLIVCTIVVYRQNVHAQSVDLGFDREGLIQVADVNRAAVVPQTETLLREVARIEGVSGVAGTNIPVATDQVLTTGVMVPGRTEPEVMGFYSVSPEFFETMGLRLLAGRVLARSAADDSSTPYEPADVAAAAERALAQRGVNVVTNSLAARRMGFTDPQQALGKQVRLSMFGSDGQLVPATIVGVVADSRFRSARRPIEPQIFFDRRIYNTMVVRVRSADPEGVRRRVGEVWRRLFPEVPFTGRHADQQLASLYARESATATTFSAFAIVAVVIACLGLFGLAAFTAQRRTKEIGIRKVFGARSLDIVKLLVWQFSKPVILANIIGAPVAWWVMQRWLNGFDSRIEIGPGPFLIAALIAFTIAIGTIAGHAIKVSRTNPIKALRYE
ncbi:ABC transporter permease [Allosphingosinicella sp.]|jgi:putative ABC transport system permease protein|uniref:ABC transporter permease n=1 Tax=Allosphingosinicella sp. TaxID=2823234 RepID=UPI002F1AF683